MQVAKLKKHHKAKIISIKQVSLTQYFMKFVPLDDFSSKPGQFVSILCGGLTLRRPFSIASFDGNEIGVLFKLKGKGTEFLSNLRVGDEIDFVGAVGNGFKIENKRSLLIGAGVGVAPVFYLKTELEKMQIPSLLISGFQTEKEIPEGIECDKICTDDGTAGLHGSVINYIRNMIEEFKPEKIYACGPKIVLQNTAEIAQRYKIPCEVAMEKEMACSIGVCRGCVIKIKDKNGKKTASVCQDGPVFNGEAVLW